MAAQRSRPVRRRPEAPSLAAPPPGDELPAATDLERFLLERTPAVALVRVRLDDHAPWRRYAALSVASAGASAWHLRVVSVRSWGPDTDRAYDLGRERVMTLPRADCRLTWLRLPVELREALA